MTNVTAQAGSWLDALDLLTLAREYDLAPTKVDPYTGRLWASFGDWIWQRAQQLGDRYDITVTEQPDPYASSTDMLRDLDGGHFTVTSAYSEHPVWSVETNVAFRIVHDIDGHYAAYSDFSQVGEERAYVLQCRTTPQAFWLPLFSESIGQLASCLVNGGFPEQKLVLTKHLRLVGILAGQ